MEDEEQPCRMGSASPVDPLAPLSDCGAGSLCSSWGSDESYLCPFGALGIDVNRTSRCFEVDEGNWQQRCVHLQTELMQLQSQASRMKNVFQEKVNSYFEIWLWA